MQKTKPTNKQILDAYGQSYQLMQDAKRYNDLANKIGKEKALKLFTYKSKPRKLAL